MGAILSDQLRIFRGPAVVAVRYEALGMIMDYWPAICSIYLFKFISAYIILYCDISKFIMAPLNPIGCMVVHT